MTKCQTILREAQLTCGKEIERLFLKTYVKKYHKQICQIISKAQDSTFLVH